MKCRGGEGTATAKIVGAGGSGAMAAVAVPLDGKIFDVL